MNTSSIVPLLTSLSLKQLEKIVSTLTLIFWLSTSASAEGRVDGVHVMHYQLYTSEKFSASLSSPSISIPQLAYIWPTSS